MRATDPSHPVDLFKGEKTQGPYERGPDFIGMAEFSSGGGVLAQDIPD